MHYFQLVVDPGAFLRQVSEVFFKYDFRNYRSVMIKMNHKFDTFLDKN